MSTIIATNAHPGVRDQVARWMPPIGAFLAGCGPVLLLGFSNGGYEVATVAGYGIALWWLVVVGLLTGALPPPRPTLPGRFVLGAILMLAVWGAVSLSWSADPERGLTEVARMVVAGGTLVLGMSAVRAGQGRVLAGGVLSALSIIVAAGVLSRLQPDLVPEASTTAEFLATRERTSWPLNYWNSLAAAAAAAAPLGVALATRARHPWTAALAVAPLPVLFLGIAFTLSRGGIIAAVCALAGVLLFVAPRLVALRTMIGPTVGGAALIVAAWHYPPLVDATGGAAQSAAGDRVIPIALLATAGVALLQAGWTTADRAWLTPLLPRLRSARAIVALGAVTVVAAMGVAMAVEAPARLGDAWDDFRVPTVSQTVDDAGGADRLASISGNGRYQVWSGALDATTDNPLAGIGLGSWESWWNPRRADTGFVRNAHSQPFELAAELGIIAGILFAVLLLTPLVAGGRSVLRRRAADADFALVGPALVAFAIAVSIDWSWQISAFAVAGMTLAAVALSRPGSTEAAGASGGSSKRRQIAASAAMALVGIASTAVLATALVAPQAVDASREAAARGDAALAAERAAEGAAAAGFAASPVLQLAIVHEQAGRLDAAVGAAEQAAERTPRDWRPWFLLARLATAQGRDRDAIAAFRRARALNPNSKLLSP